MIINGREIHFKHTVDAHCEIAALCPGHDIGKFNEVLEGDYLNGVASQTAFIIALNKGYEESLHYDNPDYTPNPLTEAEVRSLEIKDFVQLFGEAGEAFANGAQTTVEAEEVKTKKAKAVGEK